jgi:hypothetical protein
MSCIAMRRGTGTGLKGIIGGARSVYVVCFKSMNPLKQPNEARASILFRGITSEHRNPIVHKVL